MTEDAAFDIIDELDAEIVRLNEQLLQLYYYINELERELFAGVK